MRRSERGGEGRVHGFDRGVELREQGQEAGEHDCCEERGEKRGFVHGRVLSEVVWIVSKNLLHELDDRTGGILSGKRESPGKNGGRNENGLKKTERRLFYYPIFNENNGSATAFLECPEEI